MGQKNTRIDDLNFEQNVIPHTDYNLETKVDFEGLVKSDNNTNNVQLKSLSVVQKDYKLKNIMKINPSEVFSIQSNNIKQKHVKIEENNINISLKPSVRTTFINNFYVFLNKENAYQHHSNKSIMFYGLERKNSFKNDERKNFFQKSKRSKSISEINDSMAVSKVDMYSIQDFTDLELKTIKLTYKFIQDNLNQVGVIAFMKSFETLPDLKSKFDSFKFLSIDELSQSHALRTHSKKVMNIIDQLVSALEQNQLEKMKLKLFNLGERHHIYRAKKEYFLIIEYQFINAIRPIIIKKLQNLQKCELVEINEDFSITFDDEFLKSSQDDFYIDSYLNNEEILRAFEFIKIMWHKVFEIIRFYMNMGMDSFEEKLNH